MSVSGIINTHFIVAYMLLQHGTDEQKRTTCRGWPPARCAARSRCPSRLRFRRGRDQDQGRPRRRRLRVNGQKMWLTNGGSSNLVAVLVKTDEGADSVYRNMTTFLVEKDAGLR